MAQRGHESNAKLVILFLGHIEESRVVARLELTLRQLVIKALRRVIRERVAFLESEVKYAIDGDKNCKCFHQLQKNKISILEIYGSEFTSHKHKVEILINNFSDYPFTRNGISHSLN
jgi:hypothetical protein